MSVTRRDALGFLLALASSTHDAVAIMAGDPRGPGADSPARRVDPNIAGSAFAGVGALIVNGNDFTGTLIAPDAVLTAAHVVHGARPDAVVFAVNAGRDRSVRLAVREIHIHPEFTGRAGPGEVMEHDLAVVTLREPASSRVPTYPLPGEALEFGATLVIVGYGASGTGVDGIHVPASAAVKRFGFNRVDQFFTARGDPSRRIGYVFDFDGPSLETNVLPAPEERRGTLGNRLESTVAPGDSGSPAFVRMRTGRFVLVGVNTFVAQPNGRAMGTFGTLAGGMLVSAYLPWIESIAGRQAPGEATRP